MEFIGRCLWDIETEPIGVPGIGMSSSISSNSGDDRSISGERLNSLLRSASALSASSEVEEELDRDGVTMARWANCAEDGSGNGWWGQTVR